MKNIIINLGEMGLKKRDTYKYSLNFPIINPYISPVKTKAQYMIELIDKRLKETAHSINKFAKAFKSVGSIAESVAAAMAYSPGLLTDMARKEERFMELKRHCPDLKYKDFKEWYQSTRFSFDEACDHLEDIYHTGQRLNIPPLPKSLHNIIQLTAKEALDSYGNLGKVLK